MTPQTLSPAQIAYEADAANAFPSVRDTAARLAYRVRGGQIRDEFAANLAAEYLPAMPSTVTDKVFAKAWEDGHSTGYALVEDMYSELADLLDAAVAAVRG